jgi:iron complex outermembrane receptor protein
VKIIQRLSTILRHLVYLFVGCVITHSTGAFATLNLDNIERFTVVATPTLVNDNLASIAPNYRYDASNIALPLHVNDILVQSPSVTLNGQGGQIQNINIRGFSRWRIQSLIDGVPVISDRRAGSSIGFVPPSLIDSVQVSTGGTSTYLGSGAIGGAVNLMFADRLKPTLRIGYDTNQSMQAYQFAGGGDTTDFMLSHRTANNGSDAKGNSLFDQFTQSTLFLRYNPTSPVNFKHSTGANKKASKNPVTSAWTLFSNNSDIGKSSSDFPQRRITEYPTNKHWIGKIQFEFNTTNTDIDADIWWHTSSLDTETLRPAQRINESNSDASDFGGSIRGNTLGSYTPSFLNEWNVDWQIQVRGRENVAINETEFAIDEVYSQSELQPDPQKQPGNHGTLVFKRQTLNASEYNIAGLLDASRTLDNTTYAFGARVDWQHQRNQNHNQPDNQSSIQSLGQSLGQSGDQSSEQSSNAYATNLSGFVGIKHAVNRHLYSSVHLSTAFRNPSLVERFFSGETPRGSVLGNSGLRTEQATNIQGGLYFKKKAKANAVSAAVEVFHQRISNYIERRSIDENTITYRNLNSAVIRGITYALSWEPLNTSWRFNTAGALISGKDASGTRIADIPPRHAEVSAQYTYDDATLFGTLRYRASKTDIGDGERTLPDVYTLDVGANFSLSNNLSVALSVRNATNQHYYTTADDRAAFAQGKSIQGALTLLL